MPRPAAFTFIATGIVLWIVAMVVAMGIDTERLTDWLAERSQVTALVIGGSIAAGSAVALLIAWLVFRPRTAKRYRNRRR